MTGVLDKEHLYRLNNLDVVLPDGQPLRWALNLLYRSPLTARCYGPSLTLKLCARAEQEGLPVFFYGATQPMLDDMRKNLLKKHPKLIIAGMEPSKFRRLNAREKTELADRIRCSGATMLFDGLGCPRQEIFFYEFRDLLPMPALAAGAAFTPYLRRSKHLCGSRTWAWNSCSGFAWSPAACGAAMYTTTRLTSLS